MKVQEGVEIYNKLFPQGGILSDQEIELLKSKGKTIPFKKKDIIFRQDTLTSHVMFVEQLNLVGIWD